MFVGETDDSTQVRAPLRFREFGLQLSQIRAGMTPQNQGIANGLG
jgi:hypothetical protein